MSRAASQIARLIEPERWGQVRQLDGSPSAAVLPLFVALPESVPAPSISGAGTDDGSATVTSRGLSYQSELQREQLAHLLVDPRHHSFPRLVRRARGQGGGG